MARSGTGEYSVPAGTAPVTSGTTIESTAYNTLIADLVSDANTARPISAGGTGATNAVAARTAMGAAASGANTDITSIATNAGGLQTKCNQSSNLLQIIPDENLTGTRYLAFTSGDQSRHVLFGGNFYVGRKAGGGLDYQFPGYTVELRATANTDVILPTTGTLATLAGAEVLENKTLISAGTNGYFVMNGVHGVSFPAATDTLINSSSVQTLTNKTLSTGTILTGTIGGAPSFSGETSHVGHLRVGPNINPIIYFEDTNSGVSRLIIDGGTYHFQNVGYGINSFTIDNSGNVTAAANVTAYSDERLKKDVSTIDDALDLVKKMRGVRYTRTDTVEKGVGVIAQELIDVLPEVVMEANDERKTLSVAYGNIVGVLIEAIKELTARVEILETRS